MRDWIKKYGKSVGEIIFLAGANPFLVSAISNLSFGGSALFVILLCLVDMIVVIDLVGTLFKPRQ